MLFDQNDWKLKVTDIDLYANTCKLDGQSYPLSLAIKTLIPGYLSGLPSTSRESMELLEALAEAGVTISNFFSNELLTAVTNGAIVIHTQRLKSDPGGNLLS